MKIWIRHILGQLIKTYFFLLICLFSLYVIVDLSAHGVRFLSKSSASEIALYYLYSFSSFLDLFLTLTFLLTILRVLFDLNHHRELVALQVAGLSKKRLLTPFFAFAAFLSLVSYLNIEYLAPSAQDVALAFKISHKPKKKKEDTIHVYSVFLPDNSELVYQNFDRSKQELFDVFWLRSPHDIWHMKTLQIDPLRGHYVNHLKRNANRQMEKAESFVVRDFPDLPWSEEVALNRFIPFQNRSLSTLFVQACSDSAQRSSILSHLYYKLLSPLMPFLVLFAIGPICMRFSRNQPLFLIIAASIFAFISIKVVLDGMLILGENQVLPATAAIFGPIVLAFAFSLPAFARMK